MGGRVGPLLGSFIFFWIAPGTVAGWVPYALSRWRIQPPLLGVRGGRAVGGGVAAMGAAILVECFSRFTIEGRGTPAPIMPTESLVVSGLYRHVRNPMYVAVLAIIAGQALLFGKTLAGVISQLCECDLFVLQPMCEMVCSANLAEYG